MTGSRHHTQEPALRWQIAPGTAWCSDGPDSTYVLTAHRSRVLYLGGSAHQAWMRLGTALSAEELISELGGGDDHATQDAMLEFLEDCRRSGCLLAIGTGGAA